MFYFALFWLEPRTLIRWDICFELEAENKHISLSNVLYIPFSALIFYLTSHAITSLIRQERATEIIKNVLKSVENLFILYKLPSGKMT